MKTFARSYATPLHLSVVVCLCNFLNAGGDEIDQFVQREMAREKTPGLALLISTNGNIAEVKVYGSANLEHSVPVKPETVFQSASVGKQFTAAAVLLLAEEESWTWMPRSCATCRKVRLPGVKLLSASCSVTLQECETTKITIC